MQHPHNQGKAAPAATHAPPFTAVPLIICAATIDTALAGVHQLLVHNRRRVERDTGLRDSDEALVQRVLQRRCHEVARHLQQARFAQLSTFLKLVTDCQSVTSSITSASLAQMETAGTPAVIHSKVHVCSHKVSCMWVTSSMTLDQESWLPLPETHS